MTNSIAPVAFNFNSHEVRTIHKDNIVWFVASDIAKSLEYRDAGNLTRVLDDNEQGTHIVSTPSGEQQMLIINESGLYHALFKSRKKEAQAFRKWVTSEVLPSIRKTGSYQVKAKPTTKALPNCLTVEQQKAIQSVVKSRVDLLPEDKRAKGAITLWSSLKSKFGVTYKEIPEAEFTEALNVVARVVIEGEILDAEPKGMKPLKWTRLTDDITAESAYIIITELKDWVSDNLPRETSSNLFDALHDVQRAIVRSTTEMQESIACFKMGIRYLNRFRGVK